MAVETHIHAFPRHVANTTYPEAVPVYDRTTQRIRIGDGTTVNGKEIPNMSDLNGKANQSALSSLSARVSSAETAIAAQSSTIAGKADSADVTSLAGRVADAEAAIDDKADADDLSDLSSRVSVLEDCIGTFEDEARTILGEIS